jgi:hypothetical protein
MDTKDVNKRRSSKLTSFYQSQEGKLVKQNAVIKRNNTLSQNRQEAMKKDKKNCVKCKEEKTVALFYRKSDSHDGYQSYSKDCMKNFK